MAWCARVAVCSPALCRVRCSCAWESLRWLKLVRWCATWDAGAQSKASIVGLVSVFGFVQALIHTGLTSANLTTVSRRYGLTTLEAGVLVAMLELHEWRGVLLVLSSSLVTARLVVGVACVLAWPGLLDRSPPCSSPCRPVATARRTSPRRWAWACCSRAWAPSCSPSPNSWAPSTKLTPMPRRSFAWRCST
eukprot:scaffold1808_cov360-Prasinococcus_capsulatus_cf.AAC.18